jgi:hypothetical protein
MPWITPTQLIGRWLNLIRTDPTRSQSKLRARLHPVVPRRNHNKSPNCRAVGENPTDKHQLNASNRFDFRAYATVCHLEAEFRKPLRQAVSLAAPSSVVRAVKGQVSCLRGVQRCSARSNNDWCKKTCADQSLLAATQDLTRADLNLHVQFYGTRIIDPRVTTEHSYRFCAVALRLIASTAPTAIAEHIQVSR